MVYSWVGTYVVQGVGGASGRDLSVLLPLGRREDDEQNSHFFP